MKRIAALLLVLAMVFALCACGGGRSGPNGTYKLTGLKMDGQDYSSYLSMLGYDKYTITFNSDGSGSLNGGGSNVTFKWDSQYLTDNTGDKIPYQFSGNKVVLETSGVEMTFTK